MNKKMLFQKIIKGSNKKFTTKVIPLLRPLTLILSPEGGRGWGWEERQEEYVT
jgi:hypothetical protein